ncbi:MAG: YciK family oxidoreductase [Gammaproteobacteria bacterium]|jgi:NAD(P)-dependent dehydrogenase (short-subunit alcohol dehydrogenase family)
MPESLRNYKAPDKALADRVILVTGAGDGIGRAVSLALAAHGATVILLGRTVKKLESVYDEIVDGGGPTPAIYPLNLEGAKESDYEDMAERIEREYGRLDGLLHNAGILGYLSPIQHLDGMDWARVMHVNLTAPFLMTKALLPVLEKSGDASVVFTSSGVGRKGRAYWGAYAVSKFGTEGLMQVLADELENAGRVRVNSINPGATRTQMRQSAYPGEDPDTLPAPEDITAGYLYLLGPGSKGVTGQAFDAQ